MLALELHQPGCPKRLLCFAVAEQILGRAMPGLPRLDPSVSRRHARLFHRNDAWMIQDLASRHGTWLNGLRLTATHRLACEDRLDLGQASLRVVQALPLAPAPPALETAGLASRLYLRARWKRGAGRSRHRKRTFVLAATTELGRGTGPLSLPDPSISARHCRFRLQHGAWMVEDLGSRHGTIVNGSPVRTPHRLDVGDLVELGRVELVVGHIAGLGDMHEPVRPPQPQPPTPVPEPAATAPAPPAASPRGRPKPPTALPPARPARALADLAARLVRPRPAPALHTQPAEHESSPQHHPPPRDPARSDALIANLHLVFPHIRIHGPPPTHRHER